MDDFVTIPEQIDDMWVEETVTKILNWSDAKTKENGDSYKIYFPGKDVSDTKFEKAANNLEIGIITNDKIVASVYASLIRMIIDSDRYLFEFLNEDFEGMSEVPVSEYAKRLGIDETIYLDEFELNDNFVSNLYSADEKFVVSKRLEDIDLWNLKRLINESEKIVELF